MQNGPTLPKTCGLSVEAWWDCRLTRCELAGTKLYWCCAKAKENEKACVGKEEKRLDSDLPDEGFCLLHSATFNDLEIEGELKDLRGEDGNYQWAEVYKRVTARVERGENMSP
jgi:hypothetical protein